jgi:hypothetical protein
MFGGPAETAAPKGVPAWARNQGTTGADMSIFTQLNPFAIVVLTAGGLVGALITIMWMDLCPFCDRS